jgi:hypothetical protein
MEEITPAQKMEVLAAERSGKSNFTPFMSETARLQELKNLYIDECHDLDFALSQNRDRIMRTANALGGEINGSIGDETQWLSLTKILDSMKMMDDMLHVQADPFLLSEFRSEANRFQIAINKVLQANNLRLKLTTGMPELSNLARYMGADVYHKNKQGIPISYELDVLTWFWYSRVQKQFDNFWAIEGKEGSGKSTLAMELASTYMEKLGLEFDPNVNMFNNQKKEYIYNVIRKAPQGSVYIFDEAVNQANKKQWWKTDQVELMSLFTLVRYKRFTALFCIPAATELDVVLRNHRLHGIISIPPDRGIGIVKVPNLNPSGATYKMEEYAKREVIQDPAALAAFMSTFDKNRVLEFPFLPIPTHLPIWKQYEDIKDSSVTGRKMNKDFIRRMRPKLPMREEKIVGFLLSLDPKIATVNKKQVDEYSEKIGYKVTIDNLARYIARRTGISPSDMIKMPDAGEAGDIDVVTFIDLTEPHVIVFLNNLRSQERDKKG